MDYKAKLELIHELYHDNKALFLEQIDKAGFRWYTFGEREVRVLTGYGTVIDYRVEV